MKILVPGAGAVGLPVAARISRFAEVVAAILSPFHAGIVDLIRSGENQGGDS